MSIRSTARGVLPETDFSMRHQRPQQSEMSSALADVLVLFQKNLRCRSNRGPGQTGRLKAVA